MSTGKILIICVLFLTAVAILEILCCVNEPYVVQRRSLFAPRDLNPVAPEALNETVKPLADTAIIFDGVVRNFPLSAEMWIQAVLIPNHWPDVIVTVKYDPDKLEDLAALRFLKNLPNVVAFRPVSVKDKNFEQASRRLKGYPFNEVRPEFGHPITWNVENTLAFLYGHAHSREQLLQLGKKYKVVARVRVDLWLTGPVDFRGWLGEADLAIPYCTDVYNGADHAPLPELGAINDQLAMGTQDAMLHYLHIWNQIEELVPRDTPLHPETTLWIWLKKGNFNITRPRVSYHINRENRPKVIWWNASSIL